MSTFEKSEKSYSKNTATGHDVPENDQSKLRSESPTTIISNDSSFERSSELHIQEDSRERKNSQEQINTTQAQPKAQADAESRFRQRNESERKRINDLNSIIKAERESLNRFQDLIRQSDEAIKNRSVSLNTSLPKADVVMQLESNGYSMTIVKSEKRKKQEQFYDKLRAFSQAKEPKRVQEHKKPIDIMNQRTLQKNQLTPQCVGINTPQQVEQTVKKAANTRNMFIQNRRSTLSKITGDNIRIDIQPIQQQKQMVQQQQQQQSKVTKNYLRRSMENSRLNESCTLPNELTTYQRILREQDTNKFKGNEKKKLPSKDLKHNSQLQERQMQNGMQITTSALSTGTSSLQTLTKEREQRETSLAYVNMIGQSHSNSQSRSNSIHSISNTETNEQKTKKLLKLQNQLDKDAAYLKSLSKLYQGLDQTNLRLFEDLHNHCEFLQLCNDLIIILNRKDLLIEYCRDGCLLLEKDISQQFEEIKGLERDDLTVRLAVKKAYEELEYWENKDKPIEVKLSLMAGHPLGFNDYLSAGYPLRSGQSYLNESKI